MKKDEGGEREREKREEGGRGRRREAKSVTGIEKDRKKNRKITLIMTVMISNIIMNEMITLGIFINDGGNC